MSHPVTTRGFVVLVLIVLTHGYWRTKTSSVYLQVFTSGSWRLSLCPRFGLFAFLAYAFSLSTLYTCCPDRCLPIGFSAVSLVGGFDLGGVLFRGVAPFVLCTLIGVAGFSMYFSLFCPVFCEGGLGFWLGLLAGVPLYSTL